MTATVHDLQAYRKKREAEKKMMDAALFGIRYGNPNALKVRFPIRTKTYYHRVAVFNKEFFTHQPKTDKPENDKPE